MNLPRSIVLASLPFIACRFSSAQTQSASPEATRVPQQLVHRFEMGGHVWAVAFSADGHYLAAATNYELEGRNWTPKKFWGQESLISVWEVGSWKLVRSFTTRYVVINLTFTDRQGTGIWSGAEWGEESGEVVLWDVKSGQARKKFSCPDVLTGMAVSPDHSQIAVEPYGGLLLLNAKTLEVEKRFQFKEAVDFSPLHYSSDSQLLAMTLYTSKKINIWDAHSGALVRSLPIEDSDYIYEVWFHDGKNQYLLSEGDHFKFREAQTSRGVKTLGASPPDTIAMSASGSIILSPSQKFVFFGNSETRQDNPQNPYPVRVWDLETGTLLLTLKGHTNNIRAGAFSSDERLLASGDGSGRVNVWNLSSLHS